MKKVCGSIKDFLNETPPGKISQTDELAKLLAEHWHEFDGSTETSMASHKLLGRMEDVVWHSPILTFSIERHGGTVLGSTRGTIQRWSIDLDEMTASYQEIGHRQLEPTASALKKAEIESLAQDVVAAILEGNQDDRLRWKKDGTVHIVIGKLIPDNSRFKRTIEWRRKRIQQALVVALGAKGWEHVGRNVFRRDESSRP